MGWGGHGSRRAWGRRQRGSGHHVVVPDGRVSLRLLETLVQDSIERRIPPSAVECRIIIVMIQHVGLGFATVVVVVVATL